MICWLLFMWIYDDFSLWLSQASSWPSQSACALQAGWQSSSPWGQSPLRRSSCSWLGSPAWQRSSVSRCPSHRQSNIHIYAPWQFELIWNGFFFKYCCRSFFFFIKNGVGKRTKLFNCRIWFHTPLFHVSQQKMASFLEYFSNNKYRPRILITVSQALLPNPNPWPWGKRQEHRRHKLICSQGPPWPGGGRSAAYWTPHLLGHRSGQPSLGGWTLVWACRRGRRDNVLYGQSSPLHSQFLYLKGKTIILNLWNRGDNGTWISIMESHRGLTRPRMFAWEIGLLVVLVIKHQACLRRSQIWYVMGSVCGWNIK